MKNNIFKTVDHKIIVPNPPHFDIVEDKLQNTNNNKNSKYIFINHPGSIIVIPVTKDNKILLVKQYRHTIKLNSIEFVAGGCESNNFKKEALREMEEEIGFTTKLKDIKKIGTFYPSNGYSNEKITIFVAINLIKTKTNRNETEQINQIISLKIDKLQKLISSGKITDGPTLASLLVFQNNFQS